jgi:rhamnose transport system ATP-binding protein
VKGLEFRGLHKSFGGVRALSGVSFEIAQGEAHAIVGENGAGKSTLLKILSGILRPDRGGVAWNGQTLTLSGPRDALNLGIGMVYQERLSFPNLSVSANIFAGREMTGTGGRLRESEMRMRTRGLLARLHLSISPDERVETLSAAHSQLVEVARALAFDCRLLVLDEPTTALTAAEGEHLFLILEELRRRGVTLLYVSHLLPEVFRLCDRITVLRDGQYVGTFPRANTTPAAIVRAMVGRDLPPREAGEPAPDGAPLLRLSGFTRFERFEDVSLEVFGGEIVGLFGLLGSGRSQLLETLFGLHRPDRGTMELAGRPVRFGSSRDAARSGLALVPEDRQRQGLFFNLRIGDNLQLSRTAIADQVLIHRGDERRAGEALVDGWSIRASSLDATPDTLSGGNQQKLMLARWLATGPRLLLLDEPTQGVDVAAKYDIQGIIRRLAAGGTGCLLASSDLPEILGLAHRIVVMRDGRVQGELPAAAAGEEAVMRLATGEVRAEER